MPFAVCESVAPVKFQERLGSGEERGGERGLGWFLLGKPGQGLTGGIVSSESK